MAIRPIPFFEFKGTTEVLFETIADVVNKSTYRVPQFKPVTAAGEPVEVFLSSESQTFVDSIKNYEYNVITKGREKSPASVRYNETNLGDLVASYMNKKLESSPLDKIVKALCPTAYVIDARMMSLLITHKPVSTRKAEEKLRDVGYLSGIVAMSHTFAHGPSGAKTASRIVKELGGNNAMVALQSKIENINAILKLCSDNSTPVPHDNSITDALMTAPGVRNYSKIVKANRISSSILTSLVLMGRADVLKAVANDVPDTDIKWELEVAAYNASRGVGYTVFHQSAYLSYLDMEECDFEETRTLDSCLLGLSKFSRELGCAIDANKDLKAAYISGVGYVVASNEGCVIFEQVGESVCVASRSELKLTIEILKEAMGTYMSILTEVGEVPANRYYSNWLEYNKRVCLLDDYSASRTAVAQRDIDLVFKNRLMKDVMRVDVSARECLQESISIEGDSAIPIVTALSDLVSKDIERSYMFVRGMRCVPLVWLNPVEFFMETVRCYHLDVAANPEALEVFKVNLKKFFAMAHFSINGEWPLGLQKVIETLDYDEQDQIATRKAVPTEVVSKWEPNGEGKDSNIWCDGAVRTRDKTNVIESVADSVCYNDVYGLPAECTREVLYYKGKDPVKAASKYIDYVRKTVSVNNDGSYDTSRVALRPVVIIPKGEPKHNARVVAMEDTSRRKGNSVMNNNMITIADTHPGSLLGASAAKLETIEKRNTTALGKNLFEDPNDNVVNCMAGVDFTKFGHYIAFLLQIAVAEMSDKYFGQNWMAKHMAMLKRQILVIPTNGFFGKFVNIQGGDGQGLRNGNWQVMVGAIGMMCFGNMREKVKAIADDGKIFLSYFMDDNNYLVPVLVPREFRTKSKLTSYIRPIMKTCMTCIENTCGSVGLKAEASKIIISFEAYGQTGDVYKHTGKIRIPGKATSTMFVEPSSRAPSLLDLIDTSDGVGEAAVANRCKPEDAYILAVYSAAYSFVNMGFRSTNVSVILGGVALATPRFLGGLGVKPMTCLMFNKGIYRDDEALVSLIRHAKVGTEIGKDFSAFLALPKCKSDCVKWANNPIHRPRSDLPNLGSALTEKLSEALYDDPDYNISGLKEHMEKTCKFLSESYSKLPSTAPSAIMTSHPYSAVKSEIGMYALSSTAQTMLAKGQVKAARSLNKLRAYRYLEWLSVMKLPSLKFLKTLQTTDRAVMVNLGWQGEYCELHGMQRGLCLELITPCEPDSGIAHVSIVPRNSYLGVSSLTQSHGRGSFVETGNVWITPFIACVKNCVDIAESMKISTPGDDGKLHHLMTDLLGIGDTSDYVVHTIPHSPYISISTLQFVPPVNSQCLTYLSNTMSLETAHLDYNMLGANASMHLNYMQLSAVAFFLNSYLHGEATNFHLLEQCMWLEPCVELRATARRIPKLKTKLPPSFYYGSVRNSMFIKSATLPYKVDPEVKFVALSKAQRLFDSVHKASHVTSYNNVSELALTSYSTLLYDDLLSQFVDDLINSKGNSESQREFFTFCGVIAQVCYVKINRAFPGSAVTILKRDVYQDEGDLSGGTVVMDAVTPESFVVDALYTKLREGNWGAGIKAELSARIQKSTHGNMLNDPGSIGDSFKKLTLMEPRWWLSVVRTRITAIPICKVAPSTRKHLASWYLMWSQRYAHKYNISSTRVASYKRTMEMSISSNTNSAINSNAWEVIFYRSMWCGYDYLWRRARAEEVDSDDIDSFVYHLKMPFALCAFKYRVPQANRGTIRELIDFFVTNGLGGVAVSLTKACKRITDVASLVQSDLGIIYNFNFMSSVLAMYDTNELSRCKPPETLTEDRASRIAVDTARIVVMDSFRPSRVPRMDTNVWPRNSSFPTESYGATNMQSSWLVSTKVTEVVNANDNDNGRSLLDVVIDTSATIRVNNKPFGDRTNTKNINKDVPSGVATNTVNAALIGNDVANFKVGLTSNTAPRVLFTTKKSDLGKGALSSKLSASINDEDDIGL